MAGYRIDTQEADVNRIARIFRMLIVTAVAVSIAAAPSTARSAADGGPITGPSGSSGVLCVTCGLVE